MSLFPNPVPVHHVRAIWRQGQGTLSHCSNSQKATVNIVPIQLSPLFSLRSQPSERLHSHLRRISLSQLTCSRQYLTNRSKDLYPEWFQISSNWQSGLTIISNSNCFETSSNFPCLFNNIYSEGTWYCFAILHVRKLPQEWVRSWILHLLASKWESDFKSWQFVPKARFTPPGYLLLSLGQAKRHS